VPLRATLQPLVEITSVCAQDPLQALDVGEWTDCCAVLIVTTGTGSTSTKIQLQSATEPVEEAFGDVSGGLSLPLHQAGTVYVAVTGFTRYLR